MNHSMGECFHAALSSCSRIARFGSAGVVVGGRGKSASARPPPCGGRAISDARSCTFQLLAHRALWIRRRHRRSQRKERLCSLLLRPAGARFPTLAAALSQLLAHRALWIRRRHRRSQRKERLCSLLLRPAGARFPTLAAELLRTARGGDRRLAGLYQGHRLVNIIGDRQYLKVSDRDAAPLDSYAPQPLDQPAPVPPVVQNDRE